MLPEWLSLLPTWLVVGLVTGVFASLAVAGIFVVGNRFLSDPPVQSSHRIDGTDRRRGEIRQYLLDVDERFVEGHRVHGEDVDFYLPERDVAITFDPQAYFRLERAETFAVLCELEMPVVQLGRRLPFDVPADESAVGRSASRRDPVVSAFSVLGVPQSASADEVKAAYRQKVKEVHPDHGGDREAFQELREAYTTAKNHAN